MLASGFVLSDVLRLPGSTAIGWAIFDPDWYLATYPAARQDVDDPSPAAVLPRVSARVSTGTIAGAPAR